jgi:hypothetical protein
MTLLHSRHAINFIQKYKPMNRHIDLVGLSREDIQDIYQAFTDIGVDCYIDFSSSSLRYDGEAFDTVQQVAKPNKKAANA